MSIFDRPIWAKGAWGPFKGAIFPDRYVHSAGQSISGILIDFIIKSHPAYPKILEAAGKQHPQLYLNGLLETIAASKGLDNIQKLTTNLHVWPDFHGNRSPLDDPTMRGMVNFDLYYSSFLKIQINFLCRSVDLVWQTTWKVYPFCISPSCSP